MMKRSTHYLAIALFMACNGSGIVQATNADELVSVGLQKQLLVDDFAISEKSNLRRVLGKVTKANDGKPIMVADKPWESGRWGLFGFYGTVLHDGEKFQMWYTPIATNRVTDMSLKFAHA